MLVLVTIVAVLRFLMLILNLTLFLVSSAWSQYLGDSCKQPLALVGSCVYGRL